MRRKSRPRVQEIRAIDKGSSLKTFQEVSRGMNARLDQEQEEVKVTGQRLKPESVHCWKSSFIAREASFDGRSCVGQSSGLVSGAIQAKNAPAYIYTPCFPTPSFQTACH